MNNFICSKVYRCDFCGHTVWSFLELKEHFNSHLNKTVLLKIEQQCNLRVRLERLNIGHLRQANLRKIWILNDMPVEEDKEASRCFIARKRDDGYHCRFCGCRFLYFSQIIEHFKFHSTDKPTGCLSCGITFTTRAQTAIHCKLHDHQKCHVCSFCGRGFQRSFNLRVHEQEIHKNWKPFLCDICQQCFSRASNLRAHLKTHLHVKMFKCVYCKKRFSTYSNLKVHLQIHSGERIHLCTYCMKRYIQYEHLRHHLKKKHSAYLCKLCRKIFDSQAEYETHKDTEHKGVIKIEP